MNEGWLQATGEHTLRANLGGISGCIAKTAVGPMERVRILAQVNGSDVKGSWRALQHIVEQEGVRGLWRGNGANCVRQFPVKGILFASNDAFQQQLRRLSGSQRLSPALSFVAGACSGIVATVATYPLDFARTRLCGHVWSKEHARLGSAANISHPGIWSVVRDAWQQGGVAAIYRGSVPTILGSIPFQGIRLGGFDICKSLWLQQRQTEELTVIEKLCIGGLAGALAGFAVYPIDTVHRLLQMQGLGKFRDVHYTGGLDCFRKTWATGGVMRFYSGVTVYIVRMAPDSAIQFAAYHSLKDSLLRPRQDNKWRFADRDMRHRDTANALKSGLLQTA